MFTIQRFDGGDGPSAEGNEPNDKLAQHLARVKARKLLQQQKPHAGPAQPPKGMSTNGSVRVSHSAGGAGSAHLQVSPPKSAPKEKKRKREGSTSAEGVATETPRPAVKTRETETSEQVSVKKRRRPDSSERLGGEAGSGQTLREAAHDYHNEDDAPMGDTPSLDSLRKLFSLPRKLTGVAAPPEASVDDAKSKKKKSKKAKPAEGTGDVAATDSTATGPDEAEAGDGTEGVLSPSATAAEFGEVRSPGLMRLRAIFGGQKATSGPRMSIEAAEEPLVNVEMVQEEEEEEEEENNVDMDARVEDDEGDAGSEDGDAEAIDTGEAEVETEGGHEDQASGAEGEDGEVNGGPINSEGAVSGLDHVRKLLNKHLKDTRKRGKTPRAMDDEDEEALAVPDQPEEAQEAERALAMTTHEAAKAWGLDRRLVPILEANGVKGFFAVQCRVVPYLISTEHAELVRDAVVCAPTGSGKTLVYVLALLQGLKERRVLRLRGLVIVPNRDLAIQVMSEFERYAPAVGLKVGLAIGQSDFAKEQKALVGATTSTALMEMDGGPLSNDPGGHSLVDVLVATPGRLMDHLERTPGFTLQHLRYLVLDEVDRLVNQSYQDWAHRVYEAIYGQTPGKFVVPPPPSSAYYIMPATVRIRPFSSKERAILPTMPPPPLRKLLFSATLTANPQKLAMLDLRNPHYFSIGGRGTTASTDVGDTPTPVFTLPDTLTEQAIVCEAKEKPLVLLGLLCKLATQGLVLIFTSSVDSTHRLCRLLQLCASTALRTGMHTTPTGICEFSSALTQLQRKDLIRRCIARDVRVLVSSDGMARGIDLPNVATVINYDVPTQLKTYVHRVGRTARAGKDGRAVSVLKKGQESQFKKLRTGVKGGEVRSMRRKEVGDLAGVVGAYKRALAGLKDVLGREKRGRLKLVDPLPNDLTGLGKAKEVAVQKDEVEDSEDDEEAMRDMNGGEGGEGTEDAEPTESVESVDSGVVGRQSDVDESSSASSQVEEEEEEEDGDAQDGGMDVESGDDDHGVNDSAMQLDLDGLDDFEAVHVSDDEDEGPTSTAERVRPQPNGTGYPKPVRGRPRDSASAAGNRGRRGGAGGRYGRGGADGRHGRGGRGTGVRLRGRGMRGRGFVRGRGSGGRIGGRRGGRGRP